MIISKHFFDEKNCFYGRFFWEEFLYSSSEKNNIDIVIDSELFLDSISNYFRDTDISFSGDFEIIDSGDVLNEFCYKVAVNHPPHDLCEIRAIISYNIRVCKNVSELILKECFNSMYEYNFLEEYHMTNFENPLLELQEKLYLCYAHKYRKLFSLLLEVELSDLHYKDNYLYFSLKCNDYTTALELHPNNNCLGCQNRERCPIENK